MAIEDLLLLFLACGAATFALSLVALRRVFGATKPFVTQAHRQL